MKKLARTLRHKNTVSLGVVCLMDSLLFMMSNPRNAPPLILMIAFCLCIATLYFAARLALAVAQFYGVPVGKYSVRAAVATTVVIGSLLALQTMGQLTVRDMVILLPLLAIVYAYISYMRAGESGRPPRPI